jgi:potassium efflux system protein
MAMTPGEVVLRYGVGIVSFIAISVATAFLSYQVFKPNRGIAASINPRTSASAWLVLALPILVGVPLVNGALPLLGFLDTGLALQLRVLRSVSYFVIAAVLYGLAMRLFLVANRRLALMASDERQAKLAERQSESAAASASGEAMPVLPDDLHDADLISNQVRFILLVSTGLLFLVALWFVWRTLIPALGIADELVLWSSQRQVGDQIIQTPVTLWSLLVALGLMTGGFALAHNIKGVLEVGLFQRIGLDVGARYAAVTVAGYVIAGAGLVFGFAQLGLDWSKLQWIIAAFGVGLGFGLQEVLANFVSGLIILFERPIRVGDTVTIGDLSGTVSDIRIRATTITDFDNREVLLPNKTIITENVSNWTLHNDVTRIVLPIGVAYGSDVERVRELLIAVARAHPDVLDAPSPTVFFMTHADSALEFEVRVFVASILKRFPVRHDLNAAINRTLREHGIEIPFPQRDVHLKEGPQPSQNRVLPINEPE